MILRYFDTAFAADSSLHALVNKVMLWKMPVGAIIAIIALYDYSTLG